MTAARVMEEFDDMMERAESAAIGLNGPVLGEITLEIEGWSEKLEKMNPDANGNYYRQEPGFFQHKPYNYYVGILKEYFSRDYNNLKMLYLPENL